MIGGGKSEDEAKGADDCAAKPPNGAEKASLEDEGKGKIGKSETSPFSRIGHNGLHQSGARNWNKEDLAEANRISSTQCHLISIQSRLSSPN